MLLLLLLVFRKGGAGDSGSSLVCPTPCCVRLARGVVAVACAILGWPVGVAILGVKGVLRPIRPLARLGVCRALAFGPFSGAMVAVKVLVERVMPPPRALLSRLKRGARRAGVPLEFAARVLSAEWIAGWVVVEEARDGGRVMFVIAVGEV